MKKKVFVICLLLFIGIVGLFVLIEYSKNSSKNIVGTWKQKDSKWYLVLYEGGTGKGYSDEKEFKETGYAPQEYTWEIMDGVINITNTLIDKTEGFKLEKEVLKSVDGKTIYLKQ